MTLNYHCSECGALLQTTNADLLHAEIERLTEVLGNICNGCGNAPFVAARALGCKAFEYRALEQERKG